MTAEPPPEPTRAPDAAAQRERDGCLLLIIAAVFFLGAVGTGLFAPAPELTVVCFVASFVLCMWAMLKNVFGSD
jgi:uncharacterized membrane protein YoaK (UPF0700 family)